VPASILDAIKLGNWDYEPDDFEGDAFAATQALPGTGEKLEILAARIEQGLPLWHPADRRSFAEDE
jgi:hypothetical protein